uniref:Ig-like domain-containing protein n=1 Tax=Electrophorus electricus TaxID=8005 RepID=A0AAY5F119_ELEEL
MLWPLFKIKLCLLHFLTGVFCADQIGPNQKQNTEVFHKEGQSVTLECSYYSTNQYVLLYWYRQYPNKKPQYLLRKPARSSTLAEHRSDPRFSSATSYTSTQLTISGLTLADTALYYCALRTQKRDRERENASACHDLLCPFP